MNDNDRRNFINAFGSEPELFFRAPGRTELGGNHTDHQHGLVLAAPVGLFARACVRENASGEARIVSEGYEPFSVVLSDLSARPEEAGTPAALVRGMAKAFEGKGLKGFDAFISSDVPAGSGLSSSAAFEILIGRILCALTDTRMPALELAKAAKRAENVYFGKPCGLMDQAACASDGAFLMDLKDPEHPVIKRVELDLEKEGFSLCVVKCGAGHEDLTADYASIPGELARVSAFFGKTVLREVPEELFRGSLAELRKACGDRAVLRAMHVFAENRRVLRMAAALERGDFASYLEAVRESGRSSWELLQNVIPEGASERQAMAFAIASAEELLGGRGAVRVHGGGFAGTLQAYVPAGFEAGFGQGMERLLGEGCCIFL